MSPPDLTWYLRRLSGMSPAELLHRSIDTGRRTVWARRQVQPDDPCRLPTDAATARAFVTPLRASARTDLDEKAAAAVLDAADRVLAGTWAVLGVRRADSAQPDWFRDPVTGRRAPHRSLAFRIHHRDEAQTGNIKQIWELSRHHHLTVLAAAWWLTGDERYADVIAVQLQDWWRANTFLTGVHWTSGIEVGIRLISWVWIRRLLDDWPKVGDLFEHNDDAVRQIAWHQEFLAGFRSRGSSANNHVIAEAAGLLAASCAFPWYARSTDWRERATKLLERELALNTFADGINKELATDYHRFVCELGLVAAVEADASGHPLSEETWALLARMLDAAAALLDAHGAPPRQGDGDEGRALVLDDPNRNPWQTLLDTGAAVLGSPSWWPRTITSAQALLLSELAGSHRVTRSAVGQQHFPNAGLAILRSRHQDGPEIWCRCDGGPHGYLSIAAHAHADALSLEVRHDGVEVLVDPGTYCYHGEPQWREWFRSTAAHNTVTIQKASQAVSGGPFLWTTDVHTRVQECEVGGQPEQVWAAEHDGYLRLNPPARHQRRVMLDSPGRRVTIVDVVSLDAPGTADIQIHWHLGPGIDVDPHDVSRRCAQLSWQVGEERRSAMLALPEGAVWSSRRGEVDPISGWYSPRFGSRVPIWTLVGQGSVRSGAQLVTELELP